MSLLLLAISVIIALSVYIWLLKKTGFKRFRYFAGIAATPFLAMTVASAVNQFSSSHTTPLFCAVLLVPLLMATFLSIFEVYRQNRELLAIQDVFIYAGGIFLGGSLVVLSICLRLA